MTPTFAGQLKSASRKFIKDSPRSLLIEDDIEILDSTELVTWQLMTQADVEIIRGEKWSTGDFPAGKATKEWLDPHFPDRSAPCSS